MRQACSSQRPPASQETPGSPVTDEDLLTLLRDEIRTADLLALLPDANAEPTDKRTRSQDPKSHALSPAQKKKPRTLQAVRTMVGTADELLQKVAKVVDKWRADVLTVDSAALEIQSLVAPKVDPETTTVEPCNPTQVSPEWESAMPTPAFGNS